MANTEIENKNTETQKVRDNKIKEIMSMFPKQEELLETDSEISLETSQTEGAKSFKETDTKEKDIEFEAARQDGPKVVASEELSDTEKEALAKGWKPKNEYKGKEENWVSARAFIDRARLMERIDGQNKEIYEMKKSNERLAKLIKRQSKILAEEKASDYLKQKREAIAAGDVEQAEGYEEKYNQIKKEIESFKDLEIKQEAQSEIPPEVQEFIERNKSWYNDNSRENSLMKEYALRVENDLIKQYPQWSLLNRLEEVERQVKSFFKDKFENPNRGKAAAVERRTLSAKLNGPRDITYDDLPAAAKAIVNNFLKADRKKIINKDEYAKQLLLTGAISYE